ncbi:MAG TPA: polyphosphate polymerase domain-containing protein [Thermoanaerobaculia bacterium]|nr:polyphosphate polymerase domain-containing protein [Thermoanaerobaculia bacterium]HUM29753.1 polyphosphate polymerase domain-containing protein [Thermoanaerobaculia bacterium]HXK67053.1 polyphosphate polymerase domain-containing protein [Thermoanaerobaculia bacterium]
MTMGINQNPDVCQNRIEFKFPLEENRIGELRHRLAPHVEADPYSAVRPDGMYTVRSIYFDSPGRLFYWQKIDGLRVRKKIRLRTYNHPGEIVPLIMEIKHRVNQRIIKERILLPRERLTIPDLLLCAVSESNGTWTYRNHRTLDKIRFLVQRLNLRPTLLVTYEREAYFAREDSNVRITFDRNIRTRFVSATRDIFSESSMNPLFPGFSVLECKFCGLVPGWLKTVLGECGLFRRSVSKYCSGIDLCDMDRPDAIRSTA